ncbi:ATP-binding protein, partial [Streptomyces sp. NPDC024062]
GPVPSLATPVPAPAPAASAARPAPAASAAMGDDEIVVTEWTEGGLPQRRSRGRAPLGSHNLPQQSAPAAEPAARNGHNGHGGGTTAPPGLWLEAFTQAVNGVPKDPGNDTDSDDAWDKGDEK